MSRLAFVVLLIVTSGCASDSPISPSGPLDEKVVLAPGQTAAIDGTSFLLRFQGVFGDSRCPADAFCIQGGDALVRVDVISHVRQAATYDLHTGSMRPVQHRDVTVALVDLSPYPFSSRNIAPEDYRATLRVTR